ncbi:carbohydrate binding domain-containing protein [Ruminococcus sp.]|uniref:carbohydrate binding domain-containing protein n=1 Tax=Ruminococcus sp. TaxID=41978 RepID=UPI00262D593A|nr:carbohydrate binding domain-containing protein [Ruminococcus sp.]MDD7555356.1 carbohydrate binding domain-containing protein [Ruminococcus sp.]
MHNKKISAVCVAAMLLGSTGLLPGQAALAADLAGYLFHSTFETGTDSWTGRGAAKVETASTGVYAGSGALYVSGRTAAWNGATLPLGDAFTPGIAYSFSANVRYTSGGKTDTFYMKLQYTDSNGDTQYDAIAEEQVPKGDWIQLTNTSYQLPADASNMQLYIETADSTNSFYLDEAAGAAEGTVIPGAGKARTVIQGDVSGDGLLDGMDMLLARKGMIAGGFTETYAGKAADVDQSGKFEMNDMVLLQQYLLGNIKEFPKVEVPVNEWDDYQETASPEMLQFYEDSIYQMGNTTRIREKIAKAQSGEQVKLAYIGGSITEGGRTDTCYVSRSAKYFADTFGTGSNVSFNNAGMSGTSSLVGLLRAQNDILNDQPDVIFIEFSVNDHPGESYEKSFEGLVRRCLSQENEPAVIIIINRSKGGYSMQDQMAAVGRNYNVPVISMDNALTNAFNKGVLTTDDYFTDEYHPHAEGAKLISDCIGYFYRQALKTENATEPYVLPDTTVYGTEYTTATIVPLAELNNFNNGAFQKGNGYGTLPYGLTFAKNSANTPITFSTQGKGIFIVYKANSSGMGTIKVNVNGNQSSISGNKQYTWGGPDADLAYIQSTAGTLNVSISMENTSSDFTIWGIGVIQ